MKNKKSVITIALIAINVIIYLLLEFIGDTEDSAFMIKMGAVYPPFVVENKEYWRLFTANYLHFGLHHLMNNMLMLVATGTVLEKALGKVKYIILYILSGLSGSILSCYMMIRNDDIAAAAGASGAIFGVVGALLWVVILNKGRYEELTGRGMLFVIGISLYYGITTSGVDNWGHVGGLLAGFVLSIILYRKKPQKIDLSYDNQYT